MNVGTTGIEPYASPNSTTDPIAGGHARWVLGWDDTKVIKGTSTKGAFLIMNSWSAGWGANGLSYISYQVWKDQETDDMGITNLVVPVTPTPPAPQPDPVNPPVTPVIPSGVLADSQAVVTAAQKLADELKKLG
jgi:hypothetical protein